MNNPVDPIDRRTFNAFSKFFELESEEGTPKKLSDNLRREAGTLGDKARTRSKLSDSQATAALVLQGIANAIDQTFPVPFVPPVRKEDAA